MRKPVAGNPPITSRHGQPTNMGYYGKHLGVDYSVAVGTSVYAPSSGKIIKSAFSSNAGNYYEIDDGKYYHRIMHMSTRPLAVGARITQGQIIGKSGNTGKTTGPHVHWDVRKRGTAWDASYSNYYDPLKLLTPSIPPPSPYKMPAVGSKVQILKGVTRTTFKATTTQIAGHIKATNDSFIYTVRGYDSKYANRILINSVSGGGNGVALALYYTNGSRVDGWKQV